MTPDRTQVLLALDASGRDTDAADITAHVTRHGASVVVVSAVGA